MIVDNTVVLLIVMICMWWILYSSDDRTWTYDVGRYNLSSLECKFKINKCLSREIVVVRSRIHSGHIGSNRHRESQWRKGGLYCI